MVPRLLPLSVTDVGRVMQAWAHAAKDDMQDDQPDEAGCRSGRCTIPARWAVAVSCRGAAPTRVAHQVAARRHGRGHPTRRPGDGGSTTRTARPTVRHRHGLAAPRSSAPPRRRTPAGPAPSDEAEVFVWQIFGALEIERTASSMASLASSSERSCCSPGSGPPSPHRRPCHPDGLGGRPSYSDGVARLARIDGALFARGCPNSSGELARSARRRGASDLGGPPLRRLRRGGSPAGDPRRERADLAVRWAAWSPKPTARSVALRRVRAVRDQQNRS
jgi:hypothetical protein